MKKTDKTFIGIDPGLSGAVAVIDPKGSVLFFDTPTTLVSSKSSRRSYAPSNMVNLLSVIGHETGSVFLHVGIERQQAMPKQGVSSTFSTGYGFGLWIGILASLSLPYTIVDPRAWKKKTMAGMGKEKGASIIRATQLYPASVKWLERKKDHNRADALLIADYIKHLRG